MVDSRLAHVPFFAGLDEAAIAGIRGLMRSRHFAVGEYLCREGEPGDSLFLIDHGLAQVTVNGVTGPRSLGRMRRGDLLGEMSLLRGVPRSASVLASVPTDAFELSRDGFAAILARYPVLLTNLARILSHRVEERSAEPFDKGRRGEAIALLISARHADLGRALVEATGSASAHAVAAVDLRPTGQAGTVTLAESTVSATLDALDGLLATHATVILIPGSGDAESRPLVANADRVLVVGEERYLRSTVSALGSGGMAVELVLVTDTPERAPVDVAGARIVRAFDSRDSARHVSWLGRHLARTKLGLALGAGGAKGYAHIGVLHVLENAGYTIDYVAGSSIGAMIGAWLALGRSADEIEATMRAAFTPETVAATFRLTMAGTSATGVEVMTRLCRETTGERTFTGLQLPLIVMAIDLNSRMPAPITDGPIWQALLAATALVGLFPPYQRDGQRLIDGLAMVPVPAGSVIEAGADVTVSVNIMGRQMLAAWPGEEPPPPAPTRGGARMLDTLMEVMDLAQLDASERHAALADIPITPCFGPASWRDFDLADKFLTAGRKAAVEQLPALARLARPQNARYEQIGGSHGDAAVHV